MMKSKYESSTEALDKMLSKQKSSKDASGLGFEKGQSSERKDSTKKEIKFMTSSERKLKKVFTVGKSEKKKSCIATTRDQPVRQNVVAIQHTNWYAGNKGMRKVDAKVSLEFIK